MRLKIILSASVFMLLIVFTVHGDENKKPKVHKGKDRPKVSRPKDMGIVSIMPTIAGPYNVGQTVPLEIRIRNNRGFHAKIAVGVLDAKTPDGFLQISNVKLVKTGRTVIFEINIKLTAREIKNDIYLAKLVIVNASVAKSNRAQERLWRDYNPANNMKAIKMRIDSKGLYNVRADLIRIRFSTVCHSDILKFEKINVKASGFVTNKTISGAELFKKTAAIVKISLPRTNWWPGKKDWHRPVKSGQTIRPRLSLRFTSVSDTDIINLHTSVAIGSRNFGFFNRKTIPGSALGSLRADKWKQGGSFSYISSRKSVSTSSSCPVNGTYTVVWRIQAKPVGLR